MFVLFLLALIKIPGTQQHLLFPVNYCSLSAACVHDGRTVCATTPQGCCRRTFLDQCDMYEYNCDYGTQFIIIDCSPIEEFSTSTLATKLNTNYNKKIISPEPVDQGNSLLETPCSFQCDGPKTWETTVSDETSGHYRKKSSATTLTKTTIIKKKLTKLTTQRTSSSITTTQITPTKTTMPKTLNIETPCSGDCDRPNTWETTKEAVEIPSGSGYADSLNNNFQSDKSRSMFLFLGGSTRTEKIKISNSSSKTTRSKSAILKKLKIFTKYVKLFETEKTTREINSLSENTIEASSFSWDPIKCDSGNCRRPQIWLTTTRLTTKYPPPFSWWYPNFTGIL